MIEGLLEGKSVVIAGAGSGVGRESALLFAHHGARVTALDVNADAAAQTAAEIVDQGGTAISALCDVTDKAQVEAGIALAVETYGRLDVMFNNVGVTSRLGVDFLDGDMDDLVGLTKVNVGGVLNGIRAAIRVFRKQGGGGVIVNTSSLAALIGYGSPVYGSTKAAVTTITRSVALQYASEGIRVNAVCPAAMMTNFGLTATFQRTKELEDYTARQFPIGRNIEAKECAAAALFLASDLASGITGVNLPVDGGISAGIKM